MKADRIDKLLTRVAEQTTFDAYRIRNASLVELQAKRWRAEMDNKVHTSTMMMPPTIEELQHIGSALVSSLMFERHAFLVLIEDTIADLEPDQPYAKQVLEDVMNSVKARGPHTFPENWFRANIDTLAEEKAARTKAMHVEMQQDEKGDWKGEWKEGEVPKEAVKDTHEVVQTEEGKD